MINAHLPASPKFQVGILSYIFFFYFLFIVREKSKQHKYPHIPKYIL